MPIPSTPTSKKVVTAPHTLKTAPLALLIQCTNCNLLRCLHKQTRNVYVVVNFFLYQLIFIFALSLGMVIYANEFETKEKQKLTEIRKIESKNQGAGG